MKNDGWVQARDCGWSILRAIRFLGCCLCCALLVITGGMLHGLDIVCGWLHAVLPAAYPALYGAARRCSPERDGDSGLRGG